MDGTDRTGFSRRARLQAAALAIVLPADGVVAYVLGAPGWLALLYIVLGLGLAALRLWFGRAKPAPRRLAGAAPRPSRPRRRPHRSRSSSRN